MRVMPHGFGIFNIFSRAIVPSFLLEIIRRGIGGNGPSLRWRLLYPLSYKELRLGNSKAGFEPATGRLK